MTTLEHGCGKASGDPNDAIDTISSVCIDLCIYYTCIYLQ